MESLIIFLPISIFIIFRVIRSDQSKRAKRIGILTILILLLLAVTCNEYGFVPSDKKYVHVNGYYRKDGTYVRSYYRSYPGEKNKSPGKDYRWIFVGVMCIVSITGLIKINEANYNHNRNNDNTKNDNAVHQTKANIMIGQGDKKRDQIGVPNESLKSKNSSSEINEKNKEPIFSNVSSWNSYSRSHCLNDKSLQSKKTTDSVREPPYKLKPSLIATLSSIPEIRRVLQFNEYINSDIVKPDLYLNAYDDNYLTEYAEKSIARCILANGYPRIEDTGVKNRTYIRTSTVTTRYGSLSFTYTIDPQYCRYGHISFNTYWDYLNKLLNTFHYFLYDGNICFWEGGLYEPPQNLFCRYSMFRNFEIICSAHLAYKSELPINELTFFPPAYSHINVRKINEKDLNFWNRRKYREFYKYLHANWSYAKAYDSCTIYHASNPNSVYEIAEELREELFAPYTKVLDFVKANSFSMSDFESIVKETGVPYRYFKNRV